MQEIQLYIEGERVDMFKDESVVLTQTIQNIKDIGKVFTDFSKTFTIPASKTNNKIFKHYYNFDIVNGYDARVRSSAVIELNNLRFKEGKIKLEGVTLKDSLPNTYKITFFGNTVTLKELFGEDNLQALSDLTSLNQLYDASNVRQGLFKNVSTNDVLVPLITHTDRLFFDSGSNVADTGNLSYNAGTIKGCRYSQLKYAIRVHKIIEAIETRYNITFSNDFFNSSNEHYYNLFMWLHRKKGDVENLSGNNQALIDSFATTSFDVGTSTQMVSSSSLWLYGTESNYIQFDLILNTSATTEYTVIVINNGVQIYRDTITPTSNVNTVISLSDIGGSYNIYIEADSVIVYNKIEWFIRYETGGSSNFPVINTKTYTITNYTFSNTFLFDITQQMPKIKTLDFLTGLFKMFNLTAFVEDDVIVVKTLDEFYNDGGSYDITKYLDIKSSSVDAALPYKEINFKHEDTKTFLAAQHEQIVGKVWGETEYTQLKDGVTNLDGSIYTIKTPFAQAKYERLLDVANGSTTPLQVGYFTDDNQEPYIGKPLLFYPIKTFGNISFINSDSSVQNLTQFIVPSNSVALDSATSKENMNFFNEVNEYTFDETFTDTLFEKYYKNYITDIFDASNRITKVSAYLPLRILLNFTLADRFVMRGHSYKINSIKTNLKTGKSEIELLND